MSKINKLDNDTINKIAAGEVIERPMSVVKELVENSIDAGSSEIVVEIKNGGKDYIRISDNGCGMNYDQIEDAFRRHYTSKISNAEDLNTIHTMGFRGEALASISQVSKVEVYTKVPEEITGVRMIFEAGEVISKEEFGCQNGCTFIIKDLFFNVPARLKFLKSAHAEASAINSIVMSLALIKKNLSFKYINNGKTIYKTPKTADMKNVLACLYDKDLVSSMIPVEYDGGNILVNGYTSDLSYYRGNRKNQLLFINDRLVKHKRAQYFIESAYATYLPINKHPACFLNITIDPSTVDVNVHPAKTEVRIFNEDRVLGSLKTAISQALSRKNLIKEVESDTLNKKSKSFNYDVKNELQSKYKNKLENIYIDKDEDVNRKTILDEISYTSNIEKENNSSNYNVAENETAVLDENSRISEVHTPIINMKSSDNRENITIEDIFDVEDVVKREVSENKFENFDGIHKIHEDIRQLRVIGILFKTYILCENTNTAEFYMIDQHAAHERINYEKYMKQYREKNIIKQEMLVPEVVSLGFDDNNLYLENKEVFENLGFRIEVFGNNEYKISSVPLVLCQSNTKMMFLDILDSLKSPEAKTYLDEEIRKLIKKSCVNAVKANDDLKDIEIKALLESLAECDKPYTCPHGRPLIVKLSKYEIEKMFERIQS